jgi:CspA family cold shock protein
MTSGEDPNESAEERGTEMAPKDSISGQKLRGRVKWFDPGKGYGFVVAEEGGPDILLHANVLRNFGQSTVADGSLVEISIQHTARGEQAVEVFSIEPPEEPVPSVIADAVAEPDAIAQLPLEAGRVKWFDKAKGFGFANVFGKAEDVFLHIDVLRRSGLADLQPGEAVALRVGIGKRGCMAVQVTTWEAAVQAE